MIRLPLVLLGGILLGGVIGFFGGMHQAHSPSLAFHPFENKSPGLRTEPAASSPLFISLEGQTPNYYLNQQPIDVAALLEKVQQVNAAAPGWPVILEASYDVPASKLLELHWILSKIGLTIEETRVRTAPNQVGLPPAYFITRLPAMETAFAAEKPAARTPESSPNAAASPFISNLPEVDTVELHWAHGPTSKILATRKLTGDEALAFAQLWRRQELGESFIKASVSRPQILPGLSFYYQGKLVCRALVDIGNSNQIDFLEPETARSQHEGIDPNSSEGIELMEAIKVRIGSLFPQAIQAASTIH